MRARVPGSWRPTLVHAFEPWDAVAVRSLCQGVTASTEHLVPLEEPLTCPACARASTEEPRPCTVDKGQGSLF